MAQRLVRAKRRLRELDAPFSVPADHELPERLGAALAVLYLIFNEGYGPPPRDDLCDEAIRLAKLLSVLMPDEPEAFGLLALMLFHDSRRRARTGPDGSLVLLEDQDRALWDRDRIAEGWRMLERAARHRRPGPYQLQAAIAGAHAQEAPDWSLVASLYGRLAQVTPSPVVELNRAVAVAMDEGPERGLELLADIEGLERYHLLHAARADLLRRLERRARGPAVAPARPPRRASLRGRRRHRRSATPARG
jgi:RNA polymerase sigma-70 factor (ECF subfamily)